MATKMDPKCYAIIGAAMYVHQILGNGFLERVYQEAMEVELGRRNIPFLKEVEIPVIYDGVRLKAFYRADFVCYGSIIVELKAITKLTNVDFAQVYNYLKATGYDPGVLLNFGAPSLEYHRISNKFLSSSNA